MGRNQYDSNLGASEYQSPGISWDWDNEPKPGARLARAAVNPFIASLLFQFSQAGNDLNGLFGSQPPNPQPQGPPPTVHTTGPMYPTPAPVPTPQGTPESFVEMLASLIGQRRG